MEKECDTLNYERFKEYLRPRQKESHKGSFGHVCIIGGDYGYIGALRLAAEAALRVGAGLVSVATRKEHAGFLAASRPEIMAHGVASSKELKPLLSKATVLVIGPGLGQSKWAKTLLSIVLKSTLPLVIDADALNLLAKKKHKQMNWILTPHPGEASRLLKKAVSDIQKDRISAICELQKKWGGICVLKGAGTLVSDKEGSLSICQLGNPGMATGGMGDVLSGVIGGLLAQHVPLEEAAKLGVLIHALSGDSAAKEGERGMIATDLMPYLRQWVNV